MKSESKQEKYFVIGIFGLLLVLIGVAFYPIIKTSTHNMMNNQITGKATQINSGSKTPQEYYQMFQCPCCGQPLDPDNICCGAAKERIDYIDLLVDQGLSKTDVVIKMLQKYGTFALSNEGQNLLKEIKIELAKRAPKDRPIINIGPDTYDFGDVSVAKGVVSTVMTLKNDGKSDLVINNMDSSCMCTTASIIFNGVEGPIFGMSMHGNPKGWSVTIPPGEEAQLKIYYDPTVHPEAVGQHLVRIISVFSDDPVNFEKKVRVDIDQVP